MHKIVFIVCFLFIYLLGSEKKPYWLNIEKIPYRYYGIKGIFVNQKGKHYTINLASNLAKKNLIKTLNKNKNLTNNRKIQLMSQLKTDQYRSSNGRIYVFVYIDEYEASNH